MLIVGASSRLYLNVREIIHSLLKKGLYKIIISVKDGWYGPNSNVGYLDVKKDCFLIVDDEGVLEEMNFPDLYKKGCSLSTGGDGTFEVEVELEEISESPVDPEKQRVKEAREFFKNNPYSEDSEKEYVKKFLGNSYNQELEEILEIEKSKDMKNLVDSLKKQLDKNK